MVILAGWVWGAWSVAAQEPDFGLSARELVVGLPSPLTPSATAWVEAETALDCAPRGAWQAVMASLDEAMPPGTELEVEVLTPGEAVGFGRQRLSERSSVLVFRLPASMRDPLRLRYRFRHDLLAATGSFSRSVLFTLIDP